MTEREKAAFVQTNHLRLSKQIDPFHFVICHTM